MKSLPLVSVIMNCYNGEKYLYESIKSVINQTYTNWEIIFWDNQSTDNSKNICYRFKDKRIKYFYATKHLSLYKSRNLALKKISGEFISFLDVDDQWLPNKLEKQIYYFKKEDIDFIYSNFYINNLVFPYRKYLFNNKIMPSGYITNNLLKDYTVGILTLIFKKKILETYEYIFQEEFDSISDFDFVLRMSIKHKFLAIQEPLALYGRHNNNLSKFLNFKQYEELSNWYNSKKIFIIFKDFENFYKINDRINYLSYINFISSNNLIKSIKFVLKLNKIKLRLKMKLLFILFIPKIFHVYFKK